MSQCKRRRFDHLTLRYGKLRSGSELRGYRGCKNFHELGVTNRSYNRIPIRTAATQSLTPRGSDTTVDAMQFFGAFATAFLIHYYGQWPVWVAVVAGVLVALWTNRARVTDAPMDEATLALLKDVPAVEPECKDIVNALVSAPLVDDVDECAEQMRRIVVGNHMRYQVLADNPAALLAASRHFACSSHGALLTRFTVQYNLYAGSVVALGSDEQREQLYATQDAGDLGCFAFTELGAGVLSGAGCESTAVYEPERDVFVINSPTPTARKTWISQVRRLPRLSADCSWVTAACLPPTLVFRA